MLRTSKHALKFQTKTKDNLLVQSLSDFKACLQVYCDQLCKDLSKVKKFESTKVLPIISNLQHSSGRSIAYKTASEIVRAQERLANQARLKRYKKVYAWCMKKSRCSWFTSKKFGQLHLKPIEQSKFFHKPDLKNFSVVLDCRLFNTKQGNHFDEFVQISLPYMRNRAKAYKVNVPLKHHKHSRKFEREGWTRRNSIGLRLQDNQLYLDLFWEKEEPAKQVIKKSVGVDQGYKRLIACSDGKIYGADLFDLYKLVTRKKDDSRSMGRLKARCKDLTNFYTKQFFQEHSDCQLIVLEDLTGLRKGKGRGTWRKLNKAGKSTKYKINDHEQNRRVSNWSYRAVMAKLESLCAENGVHLYKVNPAYTSQTCSNCGAVDRESRVDRLYSCLHCGVEMDSDVNAAINIRRLGAMYPSDRESI